MMMAIIQHQPFGVKTDNPLLVEPVHSSVHERGVKKLANIAEP
jgi:hypothetical protein